jgi:hypothetical protein
VPFCCVALSIVDARTSTPPEDQASVERLPTATTSTSATSGSRGYHLLGAHIGLYSSRNICTITTLRLRGDFNPSAPTFSLYSSFIVCGAPVATAGDVRMRVCGPAPLLGCRLIRVRVESIYCTHSLCNTIVHYSTHIYTHGYNFYTWRLPLPCEDLPRQQSWHGSNPVSMGETTLEKRKLGKANGAAHDPCAHHLWGGYASCGSDDGESGP